MKIFVGYASSNGQSRKIAQWATDQLSDTHHTVELMSLDDAADIDIGRFDRAIFVASIHAGRYKSSLIDFVSDKADALADCPSLFLSVSLAAAGHDAEDWRALTRILVDFEEATGWTPGEVSHIAGAYKPSEYDVFTRFVMRRIIAQKEPEADLAADREYTDWDALEGVLGGWMKT